MPISKAEINEALANKADKYFDLVWYARKGDYDDLEYWAGVPQDIRKAAYIKKMDIEKAYSKDTAILSMPLPFSNYPHGFNSGVLAATRWLHTLENEGLKQANQDFPDLDT